MCAHFFALNIVPSLDNTAGQTSENSRIVQKKVIVVLMYYIFPLKDLGVS